MSRILGPQISNLSQFLQNLKTPPSLNKNMEGLIQIENKENDFFAAYEFLSRRNKRWGKLLVGVKMSGELLLCV